MKESYIDRNPGKVKWLIFIRFLFSLFLLGSTVLLHAFKGLPFISTSALPLYLISFLIFLLSFFYSLLLKVYKKITVQIYSQIIVDTIMVTVILFLTGGYYSVFSFLYLVVIIYSSMFLPRKGSLIAGVCSMQYGIMLVFEYMGLMENLNFQPINPPFDATPAQIIVKISITTAACFSIAFLSGFLAKQERKSKKELLALEDHLERVERVAHVGEMAAGLAHEIRNPLASLSGAIQLLKVDLEHDADSSRLMQIVLRETDRLSELVNNFLLFARPPEGNREYVDLGKMIGDLVSLFENDTRKNLGISIEIDLLTDIYVEIDPAHLKQILWNLLLNATEAIEDFGVVKIEMTGVKRNQEVMVEISDTGCGMNEDTIKSIFDPFYTTKSHGTGLGLSIVHRILEAYGYRIDVESKINTGSSFAIKFNNILFSKPATQ